MEHSIHHPPTIRWRALAAIFLSVFLMLSIFAVISARGVGDPGLYLVTFVQMLLLAGIVAPYVFAVIYLAGDEAD